MQMKAIMRAIALGYALLAAGSCSFQTAEVLTIDDAAEYAESHSVETLRSEADRYTKSGTWEQVMMSRYCLALKYVQMKDDTGAAVAFSEILPDAVMLDDLRVQEAADAGLSMIYGHVRTDPEALDAVRNAQQNYFAGKCRLYQEKIRKQKFAIIFLILLLLVLIDGFWRVSRWLYRKSERKRETLERMQALLHETEDKYRETKERLRENWVETYDDRFSIVRQMSEIVLKADRKREDGAIRDAYEKMREVTDYIYSDGEGQSLFESEVNHSLNNIMADFREDLPDEPEDDYRLFMYLVVGFEKDVIMLLLKCQSAGSYYSRKYRIRRKVLSLPETNLNKGRYLSFMSA